MKEIDRNRLVYLILHKHDELLNVVILKLVEFGFEKKRIVNVNACIHGQVGDYAAEVWMPDKPTQILIKKIIKTENKPAQKIGDMENSFITTEPVFTIELFEK